MRHVVKVAGAVVREVPTKERAEEVRDEYKAAGKTRVTVAPATK